MSDSDPTNGVIVINPAEPGNYRAFVPERQVNRGGQEETCAQAASAPFSI